MLPIATIILVTSSIFFANFIANAIEARGKKHSPSGLIDSSDAPLLSSSINGPDRVPVDYPALALVSSVCISVIKFFYFGTAIAAHQYLFSQIQPYTGIKYVQNTPWMKYSEAFALIMASIPALLIFDFGLPVTFVFLCWKLRRNFNAPHIQIYFGSLFETFHRKCFWWEMVNIFKKLSIALILQAIPASNAVQSALIITVLAGTLSVQVSLNPWRRKRTENLADTISSLLLIAALIYTRPTQLSHEKSVQVFISVLSAIFVLGSIMMALYHAITDDTSYQVSLQRHLANTSEPLEGWADVGENVLSQVSDGEVVNQ